MGNHREVEDGEKAKEESTIEEYERKDHMRLYSIWSQMRARCNNPKHKQYKDYGGRGITYCNEWETFNGFAQWAFDVGYDENAERSECTLDRIDNDKSYTPNNCQWISMAEQNGNRRYCHILNLNGEEHNIREWSRKLGISDNTIKTRLRRGDSIEEALKTDYARRPRQKKCG